jgi:hypothetical protein
MKRLLLLLLTSLALTGCGFHFRSPDEFPKPLHTLYFTSEKPYSSLSIKLRALLKSMRVVLVSNPKDAPYTMLVTGNHFSYPRPDIVDTTLPSSIVFSQMATLTIVNNRDKKMIATKLFHASSSLTLNSNQIYTANSNDLIHEQLNRELTSLVYYWLVSSNTKDAFNSHATDHKTITHTAH